MQMAGARWEATPAEGTTARSFDLICWRDMELVKTPYSSSHGLAEPGRQKESSHTAGTSTTLLAAAGDLVDDQ